MIARSGTAQGGPTSRTVALTVVAMLAFAANSVLCRLALGRELIDAASFSALRTFSGALTLGAIMVPRWRASRGTPADWRAVAMLFAYMVPFSFAYLSLSTGTGALILFGAVQLTMFAVALVGGERFPPAASAGLALATLGLIYLVSPGVTAPDPGGALLMTVAGIGWGFYSLLGRRAEDALASTANNFILAVPPVVGVAVLFREQIHFTTAGLVLAVSSGAIASGLGYVVWYAALRGLTAGRAATVQLSVPIIAAFGGVLLLGEAMTLRLAVASAATLGGVAVVLASRAR